MKKFLIVSVYGMILTLSSPAQTIYSEPFDSEISGQIPSGWSQIHSGNGQCQVTNTQSYSPSNSFQLGCLQSLDGRYNHDVSVPAEGIIVCKLRFMGDMNTWFRPYFHFNVNGFTYSGGYDPNNGRMHWSDGDGPGRIGSEIQRGSWYSVRIEVDWITGRASYFLNDQLEAGNCLGSTPPSNTPNDGISIASGNGGNGTIYYDDIQIETRPTSLNDGLIAYYPFNNNANDESGNGNHGTINGVTLTEDRFNQSAKAYSFDNAYIQTPLVTSASTYAVSIWVYSTDNTSDNGIGNGILGNDDGIGYGHTFMLKNGVPSVHNANGFASNFDIDANVTLQMNRWHHLVLNVSDRTVSFYADGVSYTPIGSSMIDIVGLSSWWIGKGWPSSGYFNGKLDDIRIYNRALSDSEVYLLFANFHKPTIVSISDIPNDQGGKVRLKWYRSFSDSAGMPSQVTSYGIWRKIPASMMGKTKRLRPPFQIKNDTLGLYYDYLGTVNAIQSTNYHFIAQTLQDSTASSSNDEQFLITAHTNDPNVYYISNIESGHSVDNVPPLGVTSLIATPNGSTVDLIWSPNTTDDDLLEYEIHQSASPGFIPDGNTKLATSSVNTYTDSSPLCGQDYYYQIVVRDIHDNLSSSSPEANGSVEAVSMSVGVIPKWNMVSLPLNVADPRKDVLFPNAISNAFVYDGGYEISDSLEQGKGYWVKFLASKTIPFFGCSSKMVTVNVNTGWNMIGSVSEPIAVVDIQSTPGGLVTSPFYGYDNGYSITDTIRPGKAYWVKTTGAGTLQLSSDAVIESKNHIRIVPSNDMPPAPPSGDLLSADLHRLLPLEFSLDQNHPNPFNPSTTIGYGLPDESNVRLSVINVLGQEVALLVEEKQEAGWHEQVFDASHLPSGVYFYRLMAGEFTETKKLLLMR